MSVAYREAHLSGRNRWKPALAIQTPVVVHFIFKSPELLYPTQIWDYNLQLAMLVLQNRVWL